MQFVNGVFAGFKREEILRANRHRRVYRQEVVNGDPSYPTVTGRRRKVCRLLAGSWGEVAAMADATVEGLTPKARE